MDEEKAEHEKSDTVSSPPQVQTAAVSHDDQHISISSPENAPSHHSSPRHSEHGSVESGDHISLSPHERSPSLSSDHISSPEIRPQSSENEQQVLKRDVFEQSKDRRVVIEEPTPALAVVAKDDPCGGGHISLSPHERSPSLSSDHISLREDEKSPPPSPQLEAMKRDVFEKSQDRRVVVEEKPKPPLTVAASNDPRGSDSGVVGGKRQSYKPSLSILKRVRRDVMVKKAGLGFRVFGLFFCLISFAAMAADRNQGWALDSFDHYIELRYCLFVNLIGFVYSGSQALDLSYNFATGKHIFQLRPKFRHYFDFVVDQIIAYLLISSSSSATVRIDDWQLNWGKDKFPDMATASVSMSFLAFVALASSSLISGYALCTSRSI